MHLRVFYDERLLPGDDPRDVFDAHYVGFFERWDALASVRRKPRRLFLSGESAELALYFPPELYPIALHPLVAAMGEAVVRTLLLQRLYDYLDFTTDLETVAVIPVATKISRGRSGLHLPAQMRSDALKIVTDEAWHAQFSDDFSRQIARETGCPPLRFNGDQPPAFATRLDRIREQLPHNLRGIETLLFAIVSETLISGILADIPRDERIPVSVREVVRDHAEDEGRHHVYFRSVFRRLWPALTPLERSSIGRIIPSIVYSFLEPDYGLAAQHLSTLGMTASEIEQVISESWTKEAVQGDIAQSAAPLIRYLKEAGAVDDARTAESFYRAGLIIDGATMAVR